MSGFNISGICKAQFALVDEVQSISLPDENHSVVLTLKPNHTLSEIYFSNTSERCNIEEVNDKSGSYYKALVELIHPKLEASKSVDFVYLKSKDLVLVLSDNNGNEILLGSIFMPARLNYKLGLSGKELNQRVITINAIMDIEPYYLSETVAPEGEAFSDGFSDGFS